MTRILALSLVLMLGCMHKPTQVLTGEVIAVRDPAVMQYCEDSLEHIAEDMDTRPDIADKYLIPTAADVYALSRMAMDDPNYAEMLMRVECEMWKIRELDKNDWI